MMSSYQPELEAALAAFARVIHVIAVEDMIADRMGQYASGTARDMLQQARALASLSERLDLDYMERRIRYETAGDYGIEDVIP